MKNIYILFAFACIIYTRTPVRRLSKIIFGQRMETSMQRIPTMHPTPFTLVEILQELEGLTTILLFILILIKQLIIEIRTVMEYIITVEQTFLSVFPKAHELFIVAFFYIIPPGSISMWNTTFLDFPYGVCLNSSIALRKTVLR